jgi:hypothetical protein
MDDFMLNALGITPLKDNVPQMTDEKNIVD